MRYFNLLAYISLFAVLFLSSSIVYSSKLTPPEFAYLKIQNLEQALDYFYLDNGRYPKTSEGLVILLNPIGEGKPYLQKIDKDPWGSEYIYIYPAIYGSKEFDIYSFGIDRVNDYGKNDDISNWNKFDEAIYKLKKNKFTIELWVSLFLIILFLLFMGIYKLVDRMKRSRHSPSSEKQHNT
jgi:general secretion pathway protein G